MSTEKSKGQSISNLLFSFMIQQIPQRLFLVDILFYLLAEDVELYFEFWRHKKLYVEIQNAVNKTNLGDHDLQLMYVSKT